MRQIIRGAVKNPTAFLRPINLDIFRIVAGYIEAERPNSILDIGAGICLLHSILELPDRTVRVACDIRMDNLLEGGVVLKKHSVSAHLVNSWAQQLPFKDDAFSAAAILTVFINIDDREVVLEIMREMKRVIKPGGFAVFEYRNRNNIPLRLKHRLNRLVESGLPVTAFTCRQFHEYMKQTGWILEKTIPVWRRAGFLNPSYISIGRKAQNVIES